MDLAKRLFNLLPWWLLAAFAVVATPLFVCMPLWCDVSFYDVVARMLLAGKVHYREVFDTNFPGMHWLHVIVRSCVGWSSEAMRLVDLAVLAVEAWLLAKLGRDCGLRIADCGLECQRERTSNNPQSAIRNPQSTAAGWLALALMAFYFSTGEICHAQRDGWMMLPALAALWLRRRQVERVAEGVGSLFPGRREIRTMHLDGGSPAQKKTPDPFLSSVLEGLLWGAAVWIKPYVAVVAVPVWLASVVLMWRGRRSAAIAADMCGLFVGGLAIGGAGVAWLWISGAWPAFCEIVFQWSREYEAFVTPGLRIHRVIKYGVSMAPWSLVHVVAMPVAVAAVWKGLTELRNAECRMRIEGQSTRNAERGSGVLLAVFYLAWLFQAVCLQHPHEYVIGMAILPGLAVLGTWRARNSSPLAPREVSEVAEAVIQDQKPVAGSLSSRGARGLHCGVCVLAAITLWGLWQHPLLERRRLAWWGTCLSQGSKPEVKDALSRTPGPGSASCVELAHVVEFLREQDVRDGNVICFHASEPTIYLDLNILPASRYSHLDMFMLFFPSKREQIAAEVGGTKQRFVVSDLESTGLSPEQAREQSPGDPLAFPPAMDPRMRESYPFFEPVVFRGGRYMVHWVTGPPRPRKTDDG